MKRKIIKIALAIFITVWIVITIFFMKGYFEKAEDSDFCQQKRQELYTDKEYWKRRYDQTLESDLQWQLTRDLQVKDREIDLLTLGKDFDLKSNLEGLVTVNRATGKENYRFKVIFDRNGLPIIEDFLRTVPVTSN